MKFLHLLTVSAVATTPVFAETQRHRDAHVHGVGQLDIAFDGDHIAMELHAPGADILGFEYEAKSAEDRAAIEAAAALLARPLDLFVLPDAAGCRVEHAGAALQSEEAHDDHMHDEHDKEDHHDGEHAHEHEHDTHAHDAHANDDHGKAHSADAHDAHADAASHTEFHAEYLLTCAAPDMATEITFAYFDNFPNALEVEVQIITDAGATAFEVERVAPVLDLSNLF